MLKKFIGIAIIFVTMLSVSASAVTVKKVLKKNPKKVAVPAKKTAGKETQSRPAATVPEAENDLTTVKEDMNLALKDLKDQVETVKADNSDAKVGGVIYFQYQKPVQNTGSSVKNGFDVTRAYVNFKKGLDWGASMRITLDVTRLDTSKLDTSSKQLFDFLKYAYIEMPLNIPREVKVIPFSVTAKIGLQQTAWIDYDESIWNNRYIMKTLLDNEGVMTSSDFGAGAIGSFVVPYIPEIQYQATLTNGAGYKSPETNSAKDLGFRLNSTVYSDDNIGKLNVAALLNMKDQLVNTTTNTHQGVLEVSFSNSAYGTVYAEYLKGTILDANNLQKGMAGSSIGGYLYPAPSMIPGVALIAREDYYNNNTGSNGSNVINRTMYGASYDYGKNIKFAIDVQNTQTGGGPIQSIFYVNNQVSF